MNYAMTANCQYFFTSVLSYLNPSTILVGKRSILIDAESFWFLVVVFGGVRWCLVVSCGGVWWCPVVVFGGVRWWCLVGSGGGVWWCPVVVFGGFP